MKRVIIICGMLVIASLCAAQQQIQEYISDASNPSNFVGQKMNVTSDSGFIITGNIAFFDGYLMKSDKLGNVQWFKNYPGISNIYDAQETSDHGYIALGNNGSDQAVFLKTDSAGNVQWAKLRSGNYWPGGCVYELATGGYVFAGFYFAGGPNIFVCRADSAGNVLGEKSYGLATNAYNSNFLQLTPDGGFIICGGLPSAGGIGLVKTDGAGNIQWQKTLFPGVLGGITVHVTESGYFLSAIGGNIHGAVLTDSAGNVIWAKQWPVLTNSSFYEEPCKVVSNGNQLICYGTRYVPAPWSNLIFRFDTSGNVMWSKYYGTFSTSADIEIVTCNSTPGNGLAFMGIDFDAEVFIMSMDSTMTPNCNDSMANFSPTPLPAVYGTPALVATPHLMTYSNMTYVANPRTTSAYYNCTPLSNDDHLTGTDIQTYPNPADEKITLKFPSAEKEGTVTILDISGRVIRTIESENGAEKAEVNVGDLAPGLYLWKYKTNGNVIAGKFLVQH